MQPRKLIHGWKRDKYDARDFIAKVVHPSEVTLPPSVDLSKQFPAPYDQGQVGSCTGNSSCGLLAFYKPGNSFSRLMAYFDGRIPEHTTKQDAGAMIRDVVKGLSKYGVSDESLWPYDESKFAVKPIAAAYSEGLKNKIASYRRVPQDLHSMKATLFAGNPFVFGFTVFPQFESSECAKTGIVNMPKPGEHDSVGGHAVVCVGYDDVTKRFKVRNSWGASWGQGGYFTIPYDYLTNPKLADDFWTISL